MISSLGSLTFLNPFLLLALLGLPVLWIILRITPPAPQIINFPPSRFLEGLVPDSPTTAKTPWWILLLRLIISTLIVLALAGPVLNPSDKLSGTGPVYLIIDNSWAATPSWTPRIKKARNIAAQAGRENRDIYITTTAPEPGADKPATHGPLSATQAEPVIRGLRPYSWPADYQAVSKSLKNTTVTSGTFYWLSHGISEGGEPAFIKSMQKQGDIEFFAPEKQNLPLLLRPSRQRSNTPSVLVEKPDGITLNEPVIAQLMSSKGQILDSQKGTFEQGRNNLTLTFNLPDSLQHNMAQIKLAGQKSAGSILLLDNNFKRRRAGIAAPGGIEESIPFIEAQYYLQKALEPFAGINTGTVINLTGGENEENSGQTTDVIFLPDIAGMPPSDLNRLNNWVARGGVLVRFAGPNMAQSPNNELLPAPLLKGSRSLDGALTWEDPQKLAPFPEDSPFFGTTISDDITVSQQLLSAPSDSKTVMSWATLEDGTPLITAAQRKNGMVIFVHTTATAEWSNLALSGTFVKILERIMALSPGQIKKTDMSGALQPLLYIDGYGALRQPPSFITPIEIKQNSTPQINSTHPPGFYGRSGYDTALNLGDRLPSLKSLRTAPANINRHSYEATDEINFKPHLLLLALILFFMDWFIMLFVNRRFSGADSFVPRFSKRTVTSLTGLVISLTLLCTTSPAQAQSNAKHMEYANHLHLAYIVTGDHRTDSLSRAGLENLVEVLATRTSVEPKGVVALDAAKDEMAFFPIIYWAISPQQDTLSDKAIRNLQAYMDQGGTILIDTKERNAGRHDLRSSSANQKALGRIIGAMNIPPLKAMESDHVLGRSFYLLQSFPGLYDGNTIWIEDGKSVGRDGVSPIIIGSHDWAGAWAAAQTGAQFTGGDRQRELALRFGVNLVMYALTGNYKADQVHLPYILERLDQ